MKKKFTPHILAVELLPITITPEEALQQFTTVWYKNCGLASTLLEFAPNPKCPPHTLDTCPIYQTYLSYKKKKEVIQ